MSDSCGETHHVACNDRRANEGGKARCCYCVPHKGCKIAEPVTPDRPTELREQINELVDYNQGAMNDVLKIIDQEASARSRTDQRELLERIKNFTCDDCKKYPNPENGCWDCMGKLQDNVYAELARLEGEGK